MSPNSRRRCVLLTGAAGFLGAQIARRLLREPDLTVIALVREENQEEARRRLGREWWNWPELIEALADADKVEVLPGDVSLPRLGMDEITYDRLAGRITHIIHAAADLRVNAVLAELRKTNLQGTAEMLELACRAHRDHGLERFAHISTAYVAGCRNGTIAEDDLREDFGFSNAYEQSKYEGEALVQAAKAELPVSVFRPGMIVGASDTGEIRIFNTIYYPLRLYLSGKFRWIPVDPHLPVNFVPVDYVAGSIVRLTFHPEAAGLTFHLTAPVESQPTARELIDAVRAWAMERHGLRLPRPIFARLPLPAGRRCEIGKDGENIRRSAPALKKLFRPELSGLAALLPYFTDQKQFLRKNTERLLGAGRLDWRDYLPRLLDYAVSHGFLHGTGRTVHEQILARLQSRTRPIHYYDLVEGKVIPRSPEDVRGEIITAAGALTALGVRPGDRIAIVGLNSSRYLALETAIGLVGAVSVPLYYTSPAAEIDHILTASGARLLLVGAPKIRAQLAQIQAQLPIVDFCREQPGEQPGREVISWDAFLSLGANVSVPERAPVGFGDLATLRYTSGTTGQPKGASFTHQHLRWMGQTMAALMPLTACKLKANYLSFLPMSHVVEGILAAYSPYYLPAPVNIFFLEDIKDLPRALRLIRPTIFFSVPRIFEKIWEGLERNPLGRRYVGLSAGRMKRILAGLLRRMILRKAGLDRCAQLIVGSAPCGESLLRNFRELGVEIHNAYGLTEAPLLTINRLGANRLTTVGEPLPETEIRIAEDGEVLVRGPQVMAGYFRAESGEELRQPFRDGWLLTGDLGNLTQDGSLILTGRKKELIKTSYGKYVQPARVEARLREIPGVAEAMLVGEGQPYCVALLWLEDRELNEEGSRRLDRQVGVVNLGFSHPEQVKRWAVLANTLSTDAGSLTANLKLKRRVIARQHEDVLRSLYNGMHPVESVLHLGQAVTE